MFSRPKSDKNQPINLLTLVPQHNIQWSATIDGKVDLLQPQVRIDWVRRLIEKRKKSSHYKIHLDEIGSSVWNLIDGKRTVEVIAKEMHGKFGSEIEPVYDRLGEFIRQLHQKNFISFKNS